MTYWKQTGLDLHRLSEAGGDAGGKRVTADIGQVFPEQVGRPYGIASRRGSDDLYVVALPIHLPASGILGRHSLDCAEIGDRQPEARISGQRSAARVPAPWWFGGNRRTAGPAGTTLPPWVCRDRAAVLLDGRYTVSQLKRVLRFLASGVLHGYHRVPTV